MKQQGWLVFSIVFIIVLCAAIFEAITKIRVMPNNYELFAWGGIILFIFYQSIWGNLADVSYDFFKKIKLFSADKISLEDFKKRWKNFAVFLFIAGAVAFVVTLLRQFNKEKRQ